jgi:aspartyl-tRNA(Asn)/glutamyl-tRNA(Gln) amidotransferase subunit B
MTANQDVLNQYTPTVGIECHVQLKTKTKLFSAVANDAREAAPNTLVSHIDTGMPGALPVLNEKAVELAVKAAFALNTEPQKYSYFERKHYFYPDSPAGYQISQLHAPIIIGGSVEVEINGRKKTIAINRVQLEADAGKTSHPDGADYSLVDLNRAGTPLLEIVSEPQIHSAAGAKAYARELYLLMKYADVSNVDLYHGNMRFDVNISVSKDDNLGLRTEVKNLNSFRSVEAAAEYEIKRQIELLERGEKVVQETRGWDEASQKTTPQRDKEEAHDYRYMPEPDIPPVVIDDDYIEKIRQTSGRSLNSTREILNKLSIDAAVTDDILDRQDIVAVVTELSEVAKPSEVRRVAFWLLGTEAVNYENIEKQHMVELAKMTDTGELSSTAAKTVFDEMNKTGEGPKAVAESLNLLQVSDEGEIEQIVSEVLAENAKAAEDVKNGEMKAIGFLVGQVMKKSQGKANPGLAQDIIKKQLGI